MQRLDNGSLFEASKDGVIRKHSFRANILTNLIALSVIYPESNISVQASFSANFISTGSLHIFGLQE